MLEEDYNNIFNNISEEKSLIIQKLDKNNYLENTILSKLEENNNNNNNLENDIYLSILIIKYKNDLQINILETILSKNPKKFSYIFNYIINDVIKDKNNFIKKEICLIMLNLCIDHIYIDYIKNELIKLSSIFIWVNLSREKLRLIFSKDKSLLKNFLALSQMNKVKQGGILSSIYCNYINSLIENILLFFDQKKDIKIPLSYINKGILLLISFLGINNTRKFLLPLLVEKHFIERFNLFINEIKDNKRKNNSEMDIDDINLNNKEENNNEYDIKFDLDKFEFLYHRFSYYYFYEFIYNNIYQQNKFQSKEIEKMQKKLYNLYPDKMQQLLNVNFIFSDNRKNLIDLISYLSNDELYDFLKEENLINYPKEFYFDTSIKNRNKLLQEIFICKYIKKTNILEQTLSSPLYPNESILIPENNKLIPNYYSINNFKSSIIIPKLSFIYLSLYDYLLNNYYLYKYESSYEISEDLENCLEKMDPIFDETTGRFLMKFNGWSLMGYPILDFQVLTSQSPLVGEDYPREVIGEITYDLNDIQPEIRKEWEKFKKFDTVFLIYLNKDINKILIRGAEIDSLYDEDDNNILSNIESYNINLHGNNTNKEKGEAKDNNNQVNIGFKRRMIVNLDPIQYTTDLKAGYLSNLTFHMMLRRKSKENNFKSILQSIKTLIKEIDLFPNNFTNIILNNSFLNQKQNSKINFNEERFKSIKINNKKIKYKEKQLQAIKLGIQEGLSIIKGPPGTGKTDIAVEIINYLYQNKKNEKILVITHSNNVLNDLCKKIIEADIVESKYLLRLGKGSKNIIINKNNNDLDDENENEEYLSLDGKITYMLNKRKKFLEKFLNCMLENKITIYNEYTCQTALTLIEFYFIQNINENNKNLKKNIEKYMKLSIEQIVIELKNYLIFELLRDQAERRNFIISKQSKIIALTCTYAAINRQKLIDLDFTYDTIIMEESGQILEIESFIPMTLQKNMSNLKRVILLGDENQLPPIVKSQAIRTQCLYHLSLFSRLLKSGYSNCVILNEQGRSRSEIVDLYRYKYDNLVDMKEISKKFNKNNFGFKYNIQFVNVEEFNTRGEEINSNNSYYNLAEAEYCIGLFMYMCLIGYNSNQITILTTYNGQKELIKEIYLKKCGWNKLFNNIGKICTVDKYQGQQNDFIILSLVRTKKIGYLRDIRRFIVSLSRARQGLYIFGKWELFINCLELNETMKIFKEKYNCKNRKLELCIDGNENNIVEVEDFKHMYRLVQELLKIAMNNSQNENENNKINENNDNNNH